ncbi:expressed unknown protein [Seminavis robusta]|uniref:Uncharacterized protein n=1 Tax=Seminavis robusta TaxID=568900 RepID=A0A9N8H1K0_9STRA|nr:expressed unknown protein [Seminavis robusta]|eukprot:Sro42_g025800.1 n/a (303) ;mRNA; f:120998-121906
MEISNHSSRDQRLERSRYISKDAPGKTSNKSSSRHRGDEPIVVAPQRRDCITDDRMYVADERQDSSGRTHAQEPRWNDFAMTVHDLLCTAPCFVGSIHGEGDAVSTASGTFTLPVDNTTSGRVGAQDSDDEDMLASSIHESSSYSGHPVDWGDDDDHDDADDEGDYHGTRMNNLAGRRYLAPPKQQESIYRTPSQLSAAPSFASHASRFTQRAPSASTSHCSSTVSQFGLHRSPAWSHDLDTEDEVSLADDEDWEAFVPVHNTDYRRIETSNGSKSVIDVTYMEDMFNGFSMDENQGSLPRR